MTAHHRLASSLATTLAVVLTLGLWLPGSRPASRERPARRSARTGWSARSTGSAVWVVPDQELGTTTPGAGAGRGDVGQQHDAPPGLLVAPPGVDPSLAFSRISFSRVPSLSGLASLGPHRGRAPPASLA